MNPCLLALLVVAVALALCCASADAACQPCNGCSDPCIECVPDLPCDGSVNPIVTLPSCSLLIPMDHLSNDPADANRRGNAYGTSANFNFKTYGLLVRLLHADIPLRWIIRDDKTRTSVFTDVDVRKNVSMVFPAPGDPVLRDFTSGLFVVEVEYRTAAEAIIEAYNAAQVPQEQVVVYELLDEQPGEADLPAGLAPGFLFPLAHNVNRKPFVAVFDSAPLDFWIQLEYLRLSGLVRDTEWDEQSDGLAIPWDERGPRPEEIHYTLLAKDDAQTFSDEICLTFVSEPHFAALTKEEAKDFVRVARAFAKQGGNVFFQCTGLHNYENCADEDEPCTDEDEFGFLTTKGLYESGTPPTPDEYLHASLPHLQFDDPYNSQGGNVARFGVVPPRNNDNLIPALEGTALRDSDTQKGVWNVRAWVNSDDESKGKTAMVASGRVDRTAYQGHNFYMMAGHNFGNSAPGDNTPLSEPGVRIYMNAVLVPSNRPAVCGFDIPDATPPSGKRRRLVHRDIPGTLAVTTTMEGAMVKEPRSNGGVVLCGCDTYFDACGDCGGPETECGTLGACCSLSGCTNWVEEGACSGTWVEGGNCFVTPGLCEPYSGGQGGAATGGCCNGAQCFEDTLMGCTQPGHYYLGDGVPCTPNVCEEGSCCRAEGGCEDGVLEADCSGIDEKFAGARTRCRDLGDECRRGACCHRATGICEHLHDTNCDAEGDVFHGRGSLCTAVTCSTSSPDGSVGACCASVSLTTCILTETAAACASGTGEFHGVGTHCTADTCQLASGTDETDGGESGGDGDGGGDSGTIAVAIGAALAGCTLLLLIATIVAAVAIGTAVLISMGVRRHGGGSGAPAANPWAD